MVLPLAALLAGYLGVRCLDHPRGARRPRLPERLKPRTAMASGSVEARAPGPAETAPPSRLATSAVGVVLALLTPAVPGLYLASLAFVIYNSLPILRLGERQIFRERTLGHDVLFAVFVILCFVTAQELYLAVGLLFYHAGSRILALNQALTKPLVQGLFEQQPKTAWVLRDGAELAIPVSSLCPGDRVGYGVAVRMQDRMVRVGSARYMEQERIEVPGEVQARIARSHHEGFSLVLLAEDRRIIGAIAVESRLRPEVVPMLAGLRQRGIAHLAIVSGDHLYPTRKLAEALGMDSCFAEVLPEQKADIVKRLQQQGRTVCFVGDGVNDAIAMQSANVSVSLAGATSIATDTAQIVLMSGTLEHLCDVLDLSRRLNKNLRRTFTITVVPAMISMGGALFFGVRLAGSFAITYGAFAVALANAMLPAVHHRWRRR